MGRYTGILGLLTMLALAYAFSTNRRAIRVKTVAWGLGLQIVFAIFVLRIDFGRRAFQVIGDAANKVLSYSFVGSEFLFGSLGKRRHLHLRAIRDSLPCRHHADRHPRHGLGHDAHHGRQRRRVA
jgi:nucleoside permease NupC